jgi:serine/threonine protein kinase
VLGSSLEPDRSIGPYRVLSEIGSGGMGTVFLARRETELGFEKLVAIKVLAPRALADTGAREMFFDEARVAARLSHPNLCSVFDFGEADGKLYLVMEYLEGVTLADIVRRVMAREQLGAPWWHAFAARFIAEAAEGLHAAHELADDSGQPLDVVHRDVSPENIFVTFDGMVKVLDFGVAAGRGRRHQTVVGTVKGKYGYMAPEQLRGAKVDRRADVWSLGVVLWELLTGYQLFDSPGWAEAARVVLESEIATPSRYQPTVSPLLDAAVVETLARDRDKRTPDAKSMSRSLRGYLRSSGIHADAVEISEWVRAEFAEREAAAVAIASIVQPTAVTGSKRITGAGFGDEATMVDDRPESFWRSERTTSPGGRPLPPTREDVVTEVMDPLPSARAIASQKPKKQTLSPTRILWIVIAGLATVLLALVCLLVASGRILAL